MSSPILPSGIDECGVETVEYAEDVHIVATEHSGSEGERRS
jgi:hypothetical protein